MNTQQKKIRKLRLRKRKKAFAPTTSAREKLTPLAGAGVLGRVKA